MKTLNDIANFLGVSQAELAYIAYGLPADKKYDSFEIRKKSGGARTILAPQPPLVVWQKKLAGLLGSQYRPTPCASAYIPGRGIIFNAKRHVGKKFVFNLDIRDFFPSIHFGRVVGTLRRFPYTYNHKASRILGQLLSHPSGLPVGAPTSPVVSNMVCWGLDRDLIRLAADNGCWVTRYSDDITFSTHRERFPEALAIIDALGRASVGPAIRELLDRHGFEANEKKTWLMGRDDRQQVTGLIVNERLNVRRSYIRGVRSALFDWEARGRDAAQERLLAHGRYRDRHEGAIPTIEDVLGGRIAFAAQVRGAADPVVVQLSRRYSKLKSGRSMFEADDNTVDGGGGVTVLHLSDFHFDDHDRWDSRPVLERLTVLLNRVKCDLVIVTGTSPRREEERSTRALKAGSSVACFRR